MRFETYPKSERSCDAHWFSGIRCIANVQIIGYGPSGVKNDMPEADVAQSLERMRDIGPVVRMKSRE